MGGYFEDQFVGQIERFGDYRVTREEVIEFASKYDPQPFHLDDEAAAANPIFGRISASGWHTSSMTMRMLVDYVAGQGSHTLGSPGVENLRWLMPVFPGDTLNCQREVLETRTSSSKPDIGIVKTRTTTFNQHGHPVLTMEGSHFQKRRPAI